MKVIHYIPSLDRSSGGTTAYMQLLTKELTRLVELYVVSHASENPVIIFTFMSAQLYYAASS